MTKKVTFPRVFALAMVLFTLLALVGQASAASPGNAIPPDEVSISLPNTNEPPLPDVPDNGNNQPVVDDRSDTGDPYDPNDWAVPDYAEDLTVKVQPYGSSFLYWAMLSLDPNPEIIYDTGLGMTFLSYRIDTAGKLAGLVTSHDKAFRLQNNLELLVEANDIDHAIWEKPDWRAQSIGSQLSDATVAKLKAGDYDAYEAISVIRQSDEYRNAPDTLPNLREQVDYHAAVLKSYAVDVVRGLDELHVGPLDELTAGLIPAHVIYMAQDFLKIEPDMACLDEVYDLYLTGKTSNALATFQAIGAEKCEELWAKVSKVAATRWDDEYKLLENTRLAVSFPAAAYNGPVEEVPPAPVPPVPDLPISATGN